MSSLPQVIYSLPARSPVGAVKWPAAMLLPNFGVAVFAVTLLQVLFLSNGAQALFRDSDTGWHVRNGESILQTFSLTRVDTFSYTRAGQEWFAWEWLADAAFGGAYQFAGLSGVALIAAFAIALTVWGVAQLSLSLGGNLFLTAGAVVVLIGTTSIHWLARPHVISWFLALAFLAVVEHERLDRSRWMYALPLLSCLWANVHGSFLLGPAILLIYAIGEWMLSQRKDDRKRRYVIVAFLCLLATFINPYGWHLHDHVISYLQNNYLMDHISEFRSFSFHSPGAYHVELFLFIAIVGIVALLRQRAFGPALLGLALLHMGLYSARHLPTAAVLLLPLAIPALTRAVREFGWLKPALAYSDRLRSIDQRVLGIVPLVLVLAATFAGTRALAAAGAVEFNPEVFPVRAAAYLERSNLAGRVFSKDQWGGYLIYRFEGKTKVFIDGRSDFYGQQHLETYAQVVDVKPAWKTVLQQYDIRFVLIPPDHALASTLAISPEWKRIYADSVASIFQRVN